MALLDIPPGSGDKGGDTVELKNCPFCGGEAFVRKLYTNYFVDAKHGENCPMCYMCLPYDSRWVTREAAVGAWNMRYHCSPPTFDIENIVKNIDSMTDAQILKEFAQTREDSKDEKLWEEDDFGLR